MILQVTIVREFLQTGNALLFFTPVYCEFMSLQVTSMNKFILTGNA